jgi:hypothetical protein
MIELLTAVQNVFFVMNFNEMEQSSRVDHG